MSENFSYNPESDVESDTSDLERFIHWGSSFTLTVGDDFTDYVDNVMNAVYPVVPTQRDNETIEDL